MDIKEYDRWRFKTHLNELDNLMPEHLEQLDVLRYTPELLDLFGLSGLLLLLLLLAFPTLLSIPFFGGPIRCWRGRDRFLSRYRASWW